MRCFHLIIYPRGGYSVVSIVKTYLSSGASLLHLMGFNTNPIVAHSKIRVYTRQFYIPDTSLCIESYIRCTRELVYPFGGMYIAYHSTNSRPGNDHIVLCTPRSAGQMDSVKLLDCDSRERVGIGDRAAGGGVAVDGGSGPLRSQFSRGARPGSQSGQRPGSRLGAAFESRVASTRGLSGTRSSSRQRRRGGGVVGVRDIVAPTRPCWEEDGAAAPQAHDKGNEDRRRQTLVVLSR